MHSPLTAWLALACGVALSLTTSDARADEGGVGFWPPGTFGSLAAVPSAPGWSLATIYYHTSADARVSRTFSKGGTLVAGLRARTDFLFALPTYTFAQPVAGAQAALGVMAGVGAVRVSTDVTLSGPAGQAVGFDARDSTTGGADLYGLGTLKWGATSTIS